MPNNRIAEPKVLIVDVDLELLMLMPRNWRQPIQTYSNYPPL